jgi:hypothetical protein
MDGKLSLGRPHELLMRFLPFHTCPSSRFLRCIPSMYPFVALHATDILGRTLLCSEILHIVD